MHVTVFGANGGVARLAVEQLVAAGHQVTAVVRDATKIVPRRGLHIAAVSDLSRPQNLAKVLDGAEAVLSGIGPRSTRDGPVASNVTASIIAAMLAAGVRRLITVSAAPVGQMPPDEGLFGRLVLYPVARTLLKPVFSDLASMEREMFASGLEATAIRPPRLTNGPLTRHYRQRVGGSVPRGTVISRADTADAMVAALTNPATIGQPVGVAM